MAGRTLLALLALSTVLKLALLLPADEMRLRGDEKQYLAGGVSIAEAGVPTYPNPRWDEAHASPVYPYFLAACYRLFGEDGFRWAARFFQVILSSLTALFVYLLAERAFDERTAVVAAGTTAFFPTLVAYSHQFYSETVYIFFFVALAVVLIRAPRPLSMKRVLAAGLIGGLTALTRSVFVTQAPLVVLWLLFVGDDPWRRRILSGATFLLGMALVIAPWSIRNTIYYDRFLMIDTNSGNVLYKNWNAVRQENHDVGMPNWSESKRLYDGKAPFREEVTTKNIVERNNAEIRAALRYVIDHPIVYFHNSLIRAAELVNPTSFLVRSIRMGDYRGMPAFSSEVVVYVVLLITMVALLFGAIGLVARPSGAGPLLLALFILGNFLFGVLVVSMSRYRLPIMPLLILFAVDALFRLGRSPASLSRPAVWWVVLLVVLPMAWAWILYIPYSL